MRYVELFAGIGGIRFGLEKANDRNCDKGENWKGETGLQPNWNGNRDKGNFTNIGSGLQSINNGYFQCIYANEWDKYACQIYRKHYGKKELTEGDITKIAAETIPDHDLLTAGFPCPSYSIAGKREGFKDPRGIVFFDICRIAKVKQPALLLLENVKGLLNHEEGNTFRIILYTLSELGYDCEWEVFNSKNYSVPQNRERVFIVGHLRGTGGRKIFPLGKGNQTNSELEGPREPISKCLRARGQGDLHSGLQLIGDFRYDEGLRVRKDSICPTIRQEAKGQDHSKSPLLIGGKRIRRLTPTECERLQGFPDGWTEGVSDTQRYKCLGNAVTTNVVEEIGKKILKVIK